MAGVNVNGANPAPQDQTGLRQRQLSLGAVGGLGSMPEGIRQPEIFNPLVKGLQMNTLDPGTVVRQGNALASALSKYEGDLASAGLRFSSEDGGKAENALDFSKIDLNSDGIITPDELYGATYAASCTNGDPKAGEIILNDGMSRDSIKDWEERERTMPEVNKKLMLDGAASYRESRKAVKDGDVNPNMTIGEQQKLIQESNQSIKYREQTLKDFFKQ